MVEYAKLSYIVQPWKQRVCSIDRVMQLVEMQGTSHTLTRVTIKTLLSVNIPVMLSKWACDHVIGRHVWPNTRIWAKRMYMKIYTERPPIRKSLVLWPHTGWKKDCVSCCYSRTHLFVYSVHVWCMMHDAWCMMHDVWQWVLSWVMTIQIDMVGSPWTCYSSRITLSVLSSHYQVQYPLWLWDDGEIVLNGASTTRERPGTTIRVQPFEDPSKKIICQDAKNEWLDDEQCPTFIVLLLYVICTTE